MTNQSSPDMETLKLVSRLEAHSVRYANDYGYGVASDLLEAARLLRAGVAQTPVRDPEVVAAVQEAIMRHPFWKPGLGSSGFAFGLANTAIDAYLSAVSSTEQRYPHGHPYKADAPFDPAAQEIMGVAVTSKGAGRVRCLGN